MANQEHLDILKQGVKTWNRWREEHPATPIPIPIPRERVLGAVSAAQEANFKARLRRGDLREADLRSAKLSFVDLSNVELSNSHLDGTDLSNADLSGANLSNADLGGANLNGANLNGANLSNADLRNASFIGANLHRVNLREALLIHTNFTSATLVNCRVFGISAWDLKLEGATQNDLVITQWYEPTLAVDNLEVAQFIYLLLDNPKIRDVMDTIARKAVLILGRFTPERKAVLDALREALRTHGYVPILFDFDKPARRDLTETVSTLAHLARFIIVDLTDPSSAPHEVATVIPQTVVPVQPLLWREPLMVDGRVVEQREYALFQDLRRRHHWVLPTLYYTDQAHLLAILKEDVIEPAEQKARELEKL